ncbi:hypothetical protein D5R81_08210 [Parashewanella spongiae]|uniref:Uncharacterized protein n=1 Tax=Parashewanella spongiae TaxID=342950 RepID=A0A3A6U0J0_9GAMM|nr:hypothetical protein D5R81_08210 [Parashewanella spongiae]
MQQVVILLAKVTTQIAVILAKNVSVEHFTHWVKAMMIKSSYCSNSYSYTQRSTDDFRIINQSVRIQAPEGQG